METTNSSAQSKSVQSKSVQSQSVQSQSVQSQSVQSQSVQSQNEQSITEQSTDDRVRPGSDDPPESTGDPRVDEQLAVLDQLSDRPVAEHVPLLESVHRALSDVLADIDTAGSVAEPVDSATVRRAIPASESHA